MPKTYLPLGAVRIFYRILAAAWLFLQPYQIGAQAATDADHRSGLYPVILISVDGYRRDYLDSVPTPALRRLGAEGVTAEAMLPSFPTLTFPNHYTIVTGLYPGHHRIIVNSTTPQCDLFSSKTTAAPQPSCPLAGEPIWVTAQKHGLKTATMFWPLSDIEIQGMRPTYWYRYKGSVSYASRVERVLKWIDMPRTTRPSLITLYFNEPDHTSHDYGPFSSETRKAIEPVDSAINMLLRGLEYRGILDSINIIVVSDHGMARVESKNIVVLGSLISRSKVQLSVKPTYALLRAKRPDDNAYMENLFKRLKNIPHLRVYRRAEVVGRFHLEKHIAEASMVLMPDDGWRLQISPPKNQPARQVYGLHGYDNTYTSMRALFLARGPAFKRGANLKAFENIHVYSLLARLLKVTPAPNDGSDSVFSGVLNSDR